MAAFTLLLSLSLFLWSHTAQAAVLCSKKGGAVFLREACKVHETPVDPATLGIEQLAVYDATGKKVGNVEVGTNIFFHADSYPYVLTLGVSGDGVFRSSGNARLYWTSSDCSGTPFVPLDRVDMRQHPLRPIAYVAHRQSKQTLYMADPQGTPQFMTYFSAFDEDDSKHRE